MPASPLGERDSPRVRRVSSDAQKRGRHRPRKQKRTDAALQAAGRKNCMRSSEILDALKLMAFDNTFNPYFDRCPVHDAEEAPELRRYYLKEMLERAAEAELDAIWVGRDVGSRGWRRRGLALHADVTFSHTLVSWYWATKH